MAKILEKSRKSQAQFQEKLRNFMLRQNDGFFIIERRIGYICIYINDSISIHTHAYITCINT